MSGRLVRVIAIALFPIVVFASGAWVMSAVTGRRAPDDQTPLNQRLGYDPGAAHRYWRALDASARRAEQRFLELDLVFPVFYGAALSVSLLLAGGMVSGSRHAAWVMAPVIATVVADWVENLVHLDQLRSYLAAGETGLAPGWIEVASTATIVKLLLFSVSWLVLLGLLVTSVVKRPAPPSPRP